MRIFFDILKMSAPLLFAVLGALCTEYAGVLAIFMEGAITLSGFLTAVFTVLTGSPILGFLISAALTMVFVFSVAVFSNKTQANPFLTGIAVNLFSAGLTSYCAVNFFSSTGAIVFSEFAKTASIKPMGSTVPALIAAGFAVLLFLFLRFTTYGLNLKYSGEPPSVLAVHGINASSYKIFSWTAAAFFAACAGASLTFRLGAFTGNLSAGRGWTALAAVFLGFKNPLLCVAAVFVFSAAEYAGNIMQASSKIPAAFILSVPYIIALIVFIVSAALNQRTQSE